MALHDDLLAQAQHLATKEARRPKQASLRRAASASYYALFHLLIDDAAGFVAGGAGRGRLRQQLARSFEHRHMRLAASAFAGAAHNPWKALLPTPPSTTLRIVAQTFVDLQQERHDADYNLARAFTRATALATVARAQTAFASWAQIRGTTDAEAFMLALLVKTRE
jgi:hypothetical protein